MRKTANLEVTEEERHEKKTKPKVNESKNNIEKGHGGRPPKSLPILPTDFKVINHIKSDEIRKGEELNPYKISREIGVDKDAVKRVIAKNINKPLGDNIKIIEQNRISKVIIKDPPITDLDKCDDELDRVRSKGLEVIRRFDETGRTIIKPIHQLKCRCGTENICVPLVAALHLPPPLNFKPVDRCGSCYHLQYFTCNCGRLIEINSVAPNDFVVCGGCGTKYDDEGNEIEQ